MSKEKQILQLLQKGYSQRRIADTLKVSRNTVAKVTKAVMEHPIPVDILDSISESELCQKLFPEEALIPVHVTPDFDYIHKELLKSGVTLKLLWQEYVDACRNEGKPPYMYSQYCKLYQDYVDKNSLTMHIRHKPGDKLMVDWDGATLPLYDKLTGKSCKVYLFVGTLPFSMYCYAKACLTMKEEDWINAHISMYEYFGGTTRMLIPDNLKVGILENKKHEDPIVNRAYQELADHYQTAILPARIMAPRDKAAVETTVGNLTSHIIARLRNREFFSIEVLNKAILKELDKFNQNPFQKKDGSRYSVFMEEELPFMQSLPKYPYELAQWKTATVQLNYHIAIDQQYYSVPYEYVKKKVDVRYTKSIIEVYYKGTRICSHKRLYGRRGQYSTVVDHMPANHQLYSEWDSTRFLKWASDIGEATKQVVRRMFESYRIEEQAYKGCLSLLKLSDKYTPERLEDACRIALTKIPNPRYKNIRLILEAGQDKKSSEMSKPNKTDDTSSDKYAIIRGAAYFGGEKHEK
jgi:transposase